VSELGNGRPSPADTGIPLTFAGLLRSLRSRAGLTQEELASAARVSTRSVSDLERGINRTARKDTAGLLADALGLVGAAKEAFEAVATGRASAEGFGPAGGTAIRALPRDIASFTGREHELRELVSAGSAIGTGSMVGIHAIGGMAGIGKTALAVHAAHRLAPQFPDGQIFLPLHGHTPGLRPVEPADALATLLQITGIPPAQVPSGLEARMALWRDRLAGMQLLLVLDDAASSEQIRPLVPSSTRSLVLVTSRRHLTALEEARAISLDALAAGAAAELFVRLADRPSLAPGDPAVTAIARLCGYLPLAVGLLARQLHHHTAWSATDMLAELSAAHDRLELMASENLSVAAAFNLSYEDLTQGQQRLFRRLGLHPGIDIDAYAAAALDGTGLTSARRHLAELYDQYLLTEPVRGRYRMHDLIRQHARALAARDDPVRVRDQAVSRLLDYYQFTAATADRQLARYTRPGLPAATAPPPAPASRPGSRSPVDARTGSADLVPALAGTAQALSWSRAERANLLACLGCATDTGQHARVVSLTAAMASVLRHDGPWGDAMDRHATAAAAARQLGDRLGEANALNDLGLLRYLTGDSPGATQTVTAALSIYRDLGDRLGQANALNHLGNVLLGTGDYVGAADAVTQALSIYRDLGDRQGQANALNELGSLRYLTAEYGAAADALAAALDIYRDLGDRQGQANALNNVGNVRRLTGNYPDAASALAAALNIYRDLGDREGQANALVNMGIVRRLTGNYPDAAGALAAALDINRDLGDRQGEANALHFLGAVLLLTADHAGAASALAAALDIYRHLGDRGGEVEALNEVGKLHLARGDLAGAESCHRQALKLARKIPSPWDEAHALAGLGRCALASGRIADARAGLRQALAIFRRIGAAETGDVSAELEALAEAGPPHESS
jgi:tetratricopeptide (TPR) repeat protein/transcriptional regulator with XRE-family HTH domain